MDKLQSMHQINDHVGVSLGSAGRFGAAQIIGVHFYDTKNPRMATVKYDLSVRVSDPPDEGVYAYTRLYNVDASLILSRLEWLEFNERGRLKDGPFAGPYSCKEDFPPLVDGEGYSETVAIDIDGNMKHWDFGLYDFINKEWCLQNHKVFGKRLELEHAKWFAPPKPR